MKTAMTDVPRNFKMQQVPAMPLARELMVVSPDYFDVQEAINPHMLDAKGELNRINLDIARKQWQELGRIYTKLGLKQMVVPGQPGLADMVFCANQSLPFVTTDGRKKALLSRMKSPTRHREVAFIGEALAGHGYEVDSHLARSNDPVLGLEGMGDALWVPGRRLLLGGYGFRTSRLIYDRIAPLVDADIVLFELKNPKFYHLDTCLSLLDEHSVLACREGFTAQGWDVLKRMFPRVITAPLGEADAPGFACNAFCPDQKHVVIQQGCRETERHLGHAGFVVIAVDTSEFIKSGGSVFCMKLALF